MILSSACRTWPPDRSQLAGDHGDGDLEATPHGIIAGASRTIHSLELEEVAAPRYDGKTGSRRDAGPKHQAESNRDQYIGLDVSLKETAITMREGGKRFGAASVRLILSCLPR